MDGLMKRLRASSMPVEGRKTRAHPFGYEPDTGAYDAVRCECGEVNDISARYCCRCGGEMELVDEPKELYEGPGKTVWCRRDGDALVPMHGRDAGARYERVRECELEHHDTGWVSCRECNTSWKNDRPHVYRRCPVLRHEGGGRMSEYIVQVSDLEESYYKYSDVKPETVFGHRLRGEIVRCRDCKHNVHGACAHWDYCDIDDSNGFCAWGEPRGDAE